MGDDFSKYETMRDLAPRRKMCREQRPGGTDWTRSPSSGWFGPSFRCLLHKQKRSGSERRG